MDKAVEAMMENWMGVIPVEPDIDIGLELVTPEMAQEWKSNQVLNRPLSERYVRQLISDALANTFFTTNQGIGFLKNGKLADGQHRIEMIIRTGKPQWLVVVRGLDEKAVLALDRNRARGFGQHLSMQGIKYANDVAAVARLVANVDFGWKRGFKISTVMSRSVSFYEQDEWLRDIQQELNLDELVEAFLALHDVKKDAPGVPKAAAGAFYYLARCAAPAVVVDEFVNKVGRALNIEPGSPEQRLGSLSEA